MTVSLDQYVEAEQDMMGYCPHCDEFTRPCTEPDATNYDCPECHKHDVIGCDNALLMGCVHE